MKVSNFSFHEGSPYYIETSSLICSTNQWTDFDMIATYRIFTKTVLEMIFRFSISFFQNGQNGFQYHWRARLVL